MCLTTSMSKIRLPHIYRSNHYVIIIKKSYFDRIIKKFTKLKPLSITPKSAKSRHTSLLQQNSVKFGTHFTRARKKFTPALLASWKVFPSLCVFLSHVTCHIFFSSDKVVKLIGGGSVINGAYPV